MKHTSHFVILLIFAFLFSSCEKVDLTATYISVDSTAFTMNVSQFNNEHNTNYDASELASIADQKFPDVWVTVNGASLGTWEIPCKIPILGHDSAKVILYPGIKMNGVSTTRPRYPFVQGYEFQLDLKGGEVLEIESIPLKYTATTKFEYIENFTRDYNGVFHAAKTNGINFTHIADPENPINRIGEIALVDSIMEFELESSSMNFDNHLPTSAFLEMDYKCDVENAQFSVAMLIDKSTTSVTTSEPLVIVNASTEWKKIYVNLTQSIARNQVNAIDYRVQLSGGRDDNNPVHFYFDNIKVIYQ